MGMAKSWCTEQMDDSQWNEQKNAASNPVGVCYVESQFNPSVHGKPILAILEDLG